MATFRVNLLVTVDDDDERNIWDVVADSLGAEVDDVDIIDIDEV